MHTFYLLIYLNVAIYCIPGHQRNLYPSTIIHISLFINFSKSDSAPFLNIYGFRCVTIFLIAVLNVNLYIIFIQLYLTKVYRSIVFRNRSIIVIYLYNALSPLRYMIGIYAWLWLLPDAVGSTPIARVPSYPLSRAPREPIVRAARYDDINFFVYVLNCVLNCVFNFYCVNCILYEFVILLSLRKQIIIKLLHYLEEEMHNSVMSGHLRQVLSKIFISKVTLAHRPISTKLNIYASTRSQTVLTIIVRLLSFITYSFISIYLIYYNVYFGYILLSNIYTLHNYYSFLNIDTLTCRNTNMFSLGINIKNLKC